MSTVPYNPLWQNVCSTEHKSSWQSHFCLFTIRATSQDSSICSSHWYFLVVFNRIDKWSKRVESSSVILNEQCRGTRVCALIIHKKSRFRMLYARSSLRITLPTQWIYRYVVDRKLQPFPRCSSRTHSFSQNFYSLALCGKRANKTMSDFSATSWSTITFRPE